jgi:hypothetical protein
MIAFIYFFKKQQKKKPRLYGMTSIPELISGKGLEHVLSS